ncbi:MAG: hypothetical protein U0136_06165 [Bdellovibrionota bacterium]
MSEEGRQPTSREDIVTCSLDRALAVSERAPGRLPPLGGRLGSLLDRFLLVLSEALSRRLCVQLAISRTESSSQSDAEWELHVGCRVFQETLKIVLPLELAHELTALVLKRDRSAILGRPSAEDIAALSYLIASVLAEEPLFAAQRVYLVSIEAGVPPQSAVVAQRTLHLAVRIRAVECALRVTVGQSLLKRYSAYAQTDRFSAVSRSTLFQGHRIAASVFTSLQLPPVTLIDLVPGSVIHLGHAADWRLSLSARAPTLSLTPIISAAELKFMHRAENVTLPLTNQDHCQ